MSSEALNREFVTRRHSWVAAGSRVILFSAFALAGATKFFGVVPAPRTLVREASSAGMPYLAIAVLWAAVPAAELLVAAYTVFARSARRAAGVAGALLALYCVWISYLIVVGETADCGCSMGVGTPGAVAALVRNAALLAVCGVLAASASRVGRLSQER